jgi:hypothetical protein
LGKSVPHSENPTKVNGLYGIENAQWKLVVTNFCIPRREINEESFRQGIDTRGVVAFNHGGIADDSGAI